MTDFKFGKVKKVGDVNFKLRKLKDLSKFGAISPPSVFVGSSLKYPFMNVGVLSPLGFPKNPWIYDAEEYWAEKDFKIEDVLKLRNNLLNSRFRSRATDVRIKNKFLDVTKLIGISSKSVDLEIELKNKVRINKEKDKVLAPKRLSASLKKVKITSNVKVSQIVDYVINDEVKANEALSTLYKRKIPLSSLNKILSVGVLGLKKNKKLVPTRWSITAVDDSLAKELLKKVREYKTIENYELFFGEFLGNQYGIFLFPKIWSYELFEIYSPNSSWNPTVGFKVSRDFESFRGRKDYASDTAGGYYATRLPILEYLNKRKRQASVLVVRLETPSYWAGLGVWVVRESIKRTLSKKQFLFDSLESSISSFKDIFESRYNFDCNKIFQESRLLLKVRTEKTLKDWF